MNTVASHSIPKPYYIDFLFSENSSIISKIEEGKAKLCSISECENACATHDAYELSPFIRNELVEFNSHLYLKLVNTGTIDKFSNKWGVKEITYLGAKYINPIIPRNDFQNHFGKAYVRKATSPKLIFKGLNLLDGFIDFDGEYIPGKSTLVVCSNNVNDLKFLCGLLNSKLAIFYIKSKFASSSYCGGITFSRDMINNFPVYDNSNFKRDVIAVVNKILSKGYSSDLDIKLNEVIYSYYDLSVCEIKKIEEL